MKLQIRNQKLSIDGKEYCDVLPPQLVSGTYPVQFFHSKDFNALMPFLADDVLICWSKELCRKNISCSLCDAIQIGKKSVAGSLLDRRGTFNQLYDRMKHRTGGDYKVVVEIS